MLVLTLRKAALVNRMKMDLSRKNLVLSERDIILLSVAYSICQLQNGGLRHLAEAWRNKCQWVSNVCHLNGTEDGEVQPMHSMTLIKLLQMRDYYSFNPLPFFFPKKKKKFLITCTSLMYLFT